jgi:c(7)-type cytochrome triheme protein
MVRRSARVSGPALLFLLGGLCVRPATATDAARGAPGVTAPARIEMRLPADIVYSAGVGVDSAVVFSHQTHVALAGNRCTGCHPRPFPMLRRAPEPVHRDLDAGKSCGLCHDGKRAFGVRDRSACRTCHAGTVARRAAASGAPSESPARRVPRPHAYPRGEDSPGRVTFRHETHLRGGGGCTACHPKPFGMTSAPPRPGGGMHESAACGACHDGRKAFAAGDPETCSRCHVEGRTTP